ncbi:hypothetical protein CPT_Minot_135 [Acinetobacter phage Minot]|nr:hypothetical protein CPT_Minot_135 [Acinetobacter phage Minot]QQO96586.1 hypothetical protein CPT_Mokit_135 [Acinetobacter phage Mokit]QQO96841.1 hypothetical protein CPT_Melin_140 [Acinetobacter phage Melin]
MFAAVHLVTESTDHYNYLIEYNTIEDVLNELKELGTELGCVCDYYVDCQESFKGDEHKIKELLRDAIDSQSAANEAAYFEAYA